MKRSKRFFKLLSYRTRPHLTGFNHQQFFFGYGGFMKLLAVVFACGLLMLAAPSQAASKSMISHGGLGFLYPDHNSFANPGQFALDHGAGFEIDYSTAKSTGTTSLQTATPSFVWSNGNFGLGVFGSRSGSSLTDSITKTDSVGAGLGFALAKGRLTVGLTGERSIDVNQSNDGTVGGTVNWNGDKGMGFSAGLGANTSLNNAAGDVRKGTAALGWGFNPMTKVEAVATFNDLADFGNYNLGGFLTVEGHMFYFSGGYNYLMSSKKSQLRGRAGLEFGHVDFSAFVDYTTVVGSNPTFGGTLRVAF